MTCTEIRELCVALAGENLPADAERHLQHCAACRAAHEKALSIQRLVSLRRHVAPASDFESRLLGNIDRALRPRRSGSWWGRLVESFRADPAPVYGMATAAAACLILVGSVVLFTPRDGQQTGDDALVGNHLANPLESMGADLDPAANPLRPKLMITQSTNLAAAPSAEDVVPSIFMLSSNSGPSGIFSPAGVEYGPGGTVPVDYKVP